jgi:hypothetical protein
MHRVSLNAITDPDEIWDYVATESGSHEIAKGLSHLYPNDSCCSPNNPTPVGT